MRSRRADRVCGHAAGLGGATVLRVFPIHSAFFIGGWGVRWMKSISAGNDDF